MTAYRELVKGSHYYKSVIEDYDEYVQNNLLFEDCYYQTTIGGCDSADEPMMADITQLPQRKIKIYIFSQEPPKEVMAYVEGDWAYYVYEVE